MDPISALAIAASAVSNAQTLIAAGRDATSALVKFAGAVSDVNYAAEKAKNPGIWKSLTGSAEAEAVEAFAAQKKIAALRHDLETMIGYSYGATGLEEYKETLRRVKAERERTAYRRAELKEAAVLWLVGILAVVAGSFVLGGAVYLLGWDQGRW
jgi:hypothetical protein